jgi:cytochrome c oxidase cbb3-type subunit 3
MKRIILLSLAILLLWGPALAQNASASASAPDASVALANQLLLLLYVLAGVVLVLVFATVLMLDYIFRTQFQRSIFPKLSLPALHWSWWTGLKPARATGTFDEDLGHDYDGITELDNSAPPLFNYILYGTILFAVVYLVNYHVLGTGESQVQEYLVGSNELDSLRAKQALLVANRVDEKTVMLSKEPKVLAAGEATYVRLCAVCHGTDGGGKIGPNMTDDYWLHGNTAGRMFATIQKGVPAKGMISWESQLSPAQIAEVTSYIATLHGTKPAAPKAPEGILLGAPRDSVRTPVPVLDTTRTAVLSINR